MFLVRAKLQAYRPDFGAAFRLPPSKSPRWKGEKQRRDRLTELAADDALLPPEPPLRPTHFPSMTGGLAIAVSIGGAILVLWLVAVAHARRSRKPAKDRNDIAKIPEPAPKTPGP